MALGIRRHLSRTKKTTTGGGHVAELIAQVDPETGTIIGEVDRDQAHKEGTWHASVHVWVLDHAGEVVLQRRSHTKDLFPSMWDISAAGHLKVEDDGLREVEEELGVTPPEEELTYLGMYPLQNTHADKTNNEWVRLWLWRSSLRLEDLSFTDGEVVRAGTMPVTSLREVLGGTSRVVRSWDGRVHQDETITSEDLVPLGEGYWKMLLLHL